MSHNKSILLAFLTILSIKITTAQGFINQMNIGINLPPLIGSTLDLRIETNPNPHITYQLSTSIMIDNDLPGTYNKKDVGFENQMNSGFALSLSCRYNSRQSFEKHSLFIGFKLIGGNFIHKGSNIYFSSPSNQYFVNSRKAEGLFLATAVEVGAILVISKKFSIDIGGQLSLPVYHDELLTDYSNLPGTGSVFNIQGTLTPKFYF